MDSDVSRMAAGITRPQARKLTDRIRKAGDDLIRLLLEAHQSKAWAALGYLSWDSWAQTEFEWSRREAFYQLSRAKVIAELEGVTGVPIVALAGGISVRSAEILKDPKTFRQVAQAVDRGVAPAEAVVAARTASASATTGTPASSTAVAHVTAQGAAKALLSLEPADGARRLGGTMAALHRWTSAAVRLGAEPEPSLGKCLHPMARRSKGMCFACGANITP